MSLKAVHIFFILLSMALAFGTGYWAFGNYSAEGSMGNLYFAIGSFGVGAGLIIYLIWFLRKMKRSHLS